MRLQPPTPRRTFDLTMDDGAVIRIRHHGNPRGTRLYISHGNGFAIDGYLPFWQPLQARFELVVFDFRNHGQNPPAGAASHNYARFVRDLETIYREVTERLGPKTSVGVFHSMSARAAMKQAVELGFRWNALVLFDPSNVPLPGHPVYDSMCAIQDKLVEWALKRRRRFNDPAELAREYAESRTHRTWVAGAHDLMARSVLRRDAVTGEWVLACPPQLEAATYRAARELKLWPRYEDYGGPVKLVGADPDMEGAAPTATANRAICEEYGYVYETVPGSGHMLQLEKPAECIGAMTSFLAERGIAT